MRRRDGWLHYLTLLACALVVGLFAFGSMTGTGSASDLDDESATQNSAEATHRDSPVETAPIPTNAVSDDPQSEIAIPSATGGSAGGRDDTPSTDTASTDTASTDTSVADATQAGGAATSTSTEVAGSTDDVDNTASIVDPPPSEVPVPPPGRFVADASVVDLLTTTGGNDPVGSALLILQRSGPLGEYLSQQPLMESRLRATLDGARLVSSRDYAGRIAGAVNSTLDSLAADHAEAGTGLCLLVGPGPACEQVADLNHTFSALPHRDALDELVDRFGSDAAAEAISPIADLHFSGNLWNLLREAHNTAITAELLNSWANAGAVVEPNTTELTAHLAFLSVYIEAARTERPETWDRLSADGVGDQIASTWNRIVDAYVTTDSALWNVAFLHDTTAVQELTNGQAGSRPTN